MKFKEDTGLEVVFVSKPRVSEVLGEQDKEVTAAQDWITQEMAATQDFISGSGNSYWGSFFT